MKISDIDERIIFNEKAYQGLLNLKKGELILPSDYNKIYDYVHRQKKSGPSKKSKKKSKKSKKSSSSSDDPVKKIRKLYSRNQRSEPVVIDLSD